MVARAVVAALTGFVVRHGQVTRFLHRAALSERDLQPTEVSPHVFGEARILDLIADHTADPKASNSISGFRSWGRTGKLLR